MNIVHFTFFYFFIFLLFYISFLINTIPKRLHLSTYDTHMMIPQWAAIARGRFRAVTENVSLVTDDVMHLGGRSRLSLSVFFTWRRWRNRWRRIQRVGSRSNRGLIDPGCRSGWYRKTDDGWPTAGVSENNFIIRLTDEDGYYIYLKQWFLT